MATQNLGRVYFFEFWIDDQTMAFETDIGFMAPTYADAHDLAVRLAEQLKASDGVIPTVWAEMTAPDWEEDESQILRGAPRGPNYSLKEEGE